MSSQCYESMHELFPLEGPSDSIFKTLCKILWDWEDCTMCNNDGSCQTALCPWRRLSALDPYFDFFKATTSWSMPEEIFGGRAALRNHKDLLDIIHLLKQRPHDPRGILIEEHFANRGDAQPEIIDQHRAFALAVRVMTMARCSIESTSRAPWKGGFDPLVWRDDKSLQATIESAFYQKAPPSWGNMRSHSVKRRLAAKILKTVYGMRFQGTNDLRRHLLLDLETRTIQIFHHTSVLKEHLVASMEARVGYWEVIPRQLALETLDSFQKVLFPLDKESRELLKHLVKKKNFDPDCIECDTVEYRRDDEKDIQYHYWGDRLLELFEETENQTPQGRWWQWLGFRSRGVYVMVVTLVGIAITTLLSTGALSSGIVDASKSG